MWVTLVDLSDFEEYSIELINLFYKQIITQFFLDNNYRCYVDIFRHLFK